MTAHGFRYETTWAVLMTVAGFELAVTIGLSVSLFVLVLYFHADAIQYLDGGTAQSINPQRPLPKRVLKMTQQDPTLTVGMMQMVRQGQHMHTLDARGKRQPRFFRVDDEFTSLQWSYSDQLLLDELVDVSRDGQSAVTLTYMRIEDQDDPLNPNKRTVSLVCRSAQSSMRWVRARAHSRVAEPTFQLLFTALARRPLTAAPTTAPLPLSRIRRRTRYAGCSRRIR